MTNSERTHCVRFTHAGDRYYAVKSRSYGDPMAEGITEASVRCAMPLKQAEQLAIVCIKAGFLNVEVKELQIKPKRRKSNS